MSLEEAVGHRRGSFQEDWNELLARFGHKGTPAALEDQLREAKRKEKQKKLSKHRPFDPHQALFERSQSRRRRESHNDNESVD